LYDAVAEEQSARWSWLAPSHLPTPRVTLVFAEVPDPVPAEGEVLIRVEAFGLNHAETYFRSGKWPGGPAILGIECAGTVVTDLSGQMSPGTAVVAFMGGMGRTRNGAYAELVTVPATNVVPVSTSLPWTDLIAVPEVYATAWSGLHANLGLRPGETVLVRGATSAVGQAAVNIAADLGSTVIGTTRNPRRERLLRELGAHHVLIDDGQLAEQVQALGLEVDAVLDLVGNSVLRDSLRTVRARGRVCQVGFLGGLAPVEGFDPIADLPTGVQLSFFGSFVLGSEQFPVADIPMAELIAKVEAGVYRAKPARVFGFEEVAEAHRLIEANQAGGKQVVAVRTGEWSA
jgi:NADPH:quinone reductase-like Zn-dependent oxidoreductase